MTQFIKCTITCTVSLQLTGEQKIPFFPFLGISSYTVQIVYEYPQGVYIRKVRGNPPPPLGTQNCAWGPGQGYLYQERVGVKADSEGRETFRRPLRVARAPPFSQLHTCWCVMAFHYVPSPPVPSEHCHLA